MRNKQSVIIQVILWLSIWSVFAFTASQSHFDQNYYLSLSIKVAGFVALYNIVYYLLLPLYVNAKKNRFFLISLLVFLIYVVISISIDNYFWAINPELKNKSKPLMFIIMPPLILGLTIFGAAAAIRGFSEYEKKKISEEEANNKRLEAEIQLLKSQINPHFMLNTLNNLYALSLTDTEKTPDAILKLSQMVSYILYECPKKNVLLSQEIEFINTYISLQKLRLSENIIIEQNIPEILEKDYLIEPMVLISFIENAFKHGITTKEESKIYISLRIDEDNLELKVINPIWNIKEAYNGNQSGIGITNSQQRLEHSYAEKHSLSFENKDNLHAVILKLKLDR